MIKILLRLEKNQNYDYLEREKEKLKRAQTSENKNETEKEKEVNKIKENEEISPIDESDSQITEIMDGFKKFNVKIFLMTGDPESLNKKKRFHQLFDYILVGFHSKNIIKDLQLIGKDDALFLFESNAYMTSFKKEERQLYNDKLIEKLKELNFSYEESSQGILKFKKNKEVEIIEHVKNISI